MISIIEDFKALNEAANQLEMERVKQIVNAPAPEEPKGHYEIQSHSWGNTDVDYTCWRPAICYGYNSNDANYWGMYY